MTFRCTGGCTLRPYFRSSHCGEAEVRAGSPQRKAPIRSSDHVPIPGTLLPTAGGSSTGLTPLQTPSSEPFPCTEVSPGESKTWGRYGCLSPDFPRSTRRLSVLHIFCWMIALATYEPGAAEATDWMKPPTWSGNYWGPAATRARSAGELPPLPSNPQMARWHRWGREVLRQGDIVFRLGDARSCAAWFPSAGSSPGRPAVPSRTPASSRSRTDRRSSMTARRRESSASRSRSGCSTVWEPSG